MGASTDEADHFSANHELLLMRHMDGPLLARAAASMLLGHGWRHGVSWKVGATR
jgi:hypothetical protein